LNARILDLLGALAAAVGLWLASRTKRGSVIVEEITEGTVTAVQTVARWVSRGLRNNNPGNIRKSADRWLGQSDVQPDAAFVTFTEAKYGARAAYIIFRNYQRKYGLTSITEMIARWAPPSENDTASYIRAVANRVGVSATSYVDLSEFDTAERFLRAVFRHENGIEAEALPDSVIREGILLA
jgi:hypothetical protein